MKKQLFFILLIIFTIFFTTKIHLSAEISARNYKFVTEVAKKNNTISGILCKYRLAPTNKNINFFININSSKLTKNNGLLLEQEYNLPIQIIKFDGKTIRSTINISNFELAKRIENFNLKVESSNLKKNYKTSGELWIPLELYKLPDSNFIYSKIKSNSNNSNNNSSNSEKIIDKLNYNFLGRNSYKVIDENLTGYVFYLISGHGGPDPGAIGFRDGIELHEDEYAYDITIRLAKKLLESNAKVYMIVQDPTDGIRDDFFLKNSTDEHLINGDSISYVQVERLKQRTDLVNKYTQINKKTAKKQILLELHVDSRITDQRIDIFFYHRNNCNESKKLSNTLLNTIKKKYELAQPGRGYKGTVSTRDLYTLRNTSITASYIELGNIQNPADQIRLIQPNNRQAISNWLYDGILNMYYHKEKKRKK